MRDSISHRGTERNRRAFHRLVAEEARLTALRLGEWALEPASAEVAVALAR